MKTLVMSACAFALLACGSGGRVMDGNSARAQEEGSGNGGGTTASSSSNSAANQPSLLIDPLGQLLEPVGLGFEVKTELLSASGEIITAQAYGVDLLPVLIDVDGDGSNGLLGADISVQVFALLTTFNVDVRKLDGAPESLPLKVEAIIRDPSDILGLVGSDLRVYLGYDALSSNAPLTFNAGIVVFDTLLDQLPDITTATLNTQATGAAAHHTALGGVFNQATPEDERSDALNLGLRMEPVPADATVRVLFGQDVQRNEIELTTSAASALQVSADTWDGLASAPDRAEMQSVLFDQLAGSVLLTVEGASGLNVDPDRDLRVQYDADAPLALLEYRSTDAQAGVLYSQIHARLLDVPSHWEVEQSAAGRLSLSAPNGIGLMEIGLAKRGPILWPAGQEPGMPFVEHALRQETLDASRSTAIRLKGVQELISDDTDGTYIKAHLVSAPLHVYVSEGADFVDARIPNLPEIIELHLPDADDLVSLDFSASASADYLVLRAQDGTEVTNARIEPLPQSLTVCVSSDETCGSAGSSTDASISLIASEPILFNYDEQRGNEDQTVIRDLRVEHLNISLGESGGFKKGYVFFDTDDTLFSGYILQEEPSNGFELSFSDGTHAQDRLVTWKNFIQIDRRDGSMKCPGRQDLAIKAGGRFYDADFVVDTLCQ